MKTIIFILAGCFVFLSCSENEEQKNIQEKKNL
jgi:hypothetical protein